MLDTLKTIIKFHKDHFYRYLLQHNPLNAHKISCYPEQNPHTCCIPQTPDLTDTHVTKHDLSRKINTEDDQLCQLADFSSET